MTSDSRFGTEAGVDTPVTPSANALLPFSFRFYGNDFTTVWVSPKGALKFGGPLTAGASEVNLRANEMIAPAWANSFTATEVLAATGPDNSWARFRWVHAGYVAGPVGTQVAQVAFDVYLFPDGRIRFDYGRDGKDSGPRVVGISNGFGKAIVVGTFEANELEFADSRLFTPTSILGGPTVTIGRPESGAVYVDDARQGAPAPGFGYAVASGDLTIEATAASAVVGAVRLDLYVGATLLATSTSGTVTATWTPPAGGLAQYTVWAEATDASGARNAVARDVVATGSSLTVDELLTPAVVVYYPVGGEWFESGVYVSTQYVTVCNAVEIVFALSGDDGRTFTDVATRNYQGPFTVYSGLQRPPEYSYSIPAGGIESAEAKVRVTVTGSDCLGRGARATSAENSGEFTIDTNGLSVRVDAIGVSMTNGWHTVSPVFDFAGHALNGPSRIERSRNGEAFVVGAQYVDEMEATGTAPNHWRWLSTPVLADPPSSTSERQQGRYAMAFSYDTPVTSMTTDAVAYRALEHAIPAAGFERAQAWVRYDAVDPEITGIMDLEFLDASGDAVATLTATLLPQVWTHIDAPLPTTSAVVTAARATFSASADAGASLPNSVDHVFLVDGVRFVNDDAWTESADGEHAWVARVVDQSGATEDSAPEPVLVDVSRPTGTVSINDGAAYAPDAPVTLYFTEADAASGVAEVKISNSPAFTGAQWQPYQPTLTWSLEPLGVGEDVATRSVYAHFRDRAGQQTQDHVFDDVIVDGPAPVMGTDFLPGSGWHAGPNITVSLDATDNLALDAATAVVSVHASPTGEDWQPGELNGEAAAARVSRNASFATEGTHYARFSVRDLAGNGAESGAHTFMVDLNAPSCSVNVQEEVTNSQTVTVDFESTDSASGTDTVTFWVDDGSRTTVNYGLVTTTQAMLPARDGERRVNAQFTDAVGHVSAECFDTVILDTRAPLVTPETPAPGSTGVPTTTSIRADWRDDRSAAFDVSEVDPETGRMLLQDVSSGAPAVDVTALTERTDQYIRYPSPSAAPLLPSTTYEVTVEVKDRAGNLGSVSWQFRTGLM